MAASQRRNHEPSVAVRAVDLLLAAYQAWLSPLLPQSCRFTPTCSSYMRTAIVRFGLRRGVPMGLRRIGRCHPFHPGGYDPVPENDHDSSTA